MQDGQMQPSQTEVPKGHLHIKHVGLLYVALVVVSFVAVVVTGLGVYYLQQGQIDSLSKSLSDEHNQKTGTTKDVVAQLATFTRPTVPFSFTYPDNWVVVGDHAFAADVKAGTYPNYSFTLYAPSTTVEQTAAGSPATSKGARIEVYAYRNNTQKTVADLKKSADFAATAKDVRDVTIGDVPAVQYSWAASGQETVDSAVFKDGWQYTIKFDAGSDEKNSPALSDYDALVKSFKFN